MKKKPITTPFGQWQYPGAVTRIPSNTITMENVPYPVIGVDDLGVTKMMMPGGGYVFPGSAVTEYPVMGSGGEMIRRADGSYSRRGMWDNIRDNKGSGKKPTKEMLEQERKIRAQEKKKGGSVQDREMVEGVADILRRVKDLENRQELARYMTSNFEDENVSYDRQEFMEDVDLDEMKNGGIPERYKNMGFTKVGVKKQSTSAGKKWMVLAKKGDKYKVVHGGYKGMKDYTQHGSENRRERFWDRMGGRDSAKAKDPFSPLYWHKRFGTWAEGGETVDDYQFGGPSQMPASLAAYLQRPENIQEAKQRIEDESKGFTYENRVNRALGNPKRAAATLSEQRQSDVGPVDNVRHGAAGMYTTQAMRDYLMERGVPAGAASAMGFIGANVAGAAHEAKAFPASLEGDYRNIPAAARITAEDMFNNLTGSLVGVNPFMTQSEREQFLLNASDNNMLPDGYERIPYSKKESPENMYVKRDGGWADGLVQFLGGGTQYLPTPVNPGERMTINRNYNVSEMKDPLRQSMKTMGAATLNPYMYAMTPENFGAFSGIADIAKAAGALSNVGLGYSKLFNPSRTATFTDANGKKTTYNVMNNRQHDRALKQYDTPEMMQTAPTYPMMPTIGPSMDDQPMMAALGMQVPPTFEEWLQETGQQLMEGSEAVLYKQYQDYLRNNPSQATPESNPATPAQTNVSSKTRFSTMGDPQGQALAFGTSAALSSIANNRNYRDMQDLYTQRTQELGNTDNRFDVGFTGYNPFGDYTLNRAQGMNMMPNRTNGVRDSGNNFSYGFGKNASSMKNGGQYEEGGEYEMNDQELAAFLAAGGQVEYL